MEYMIWIWLGAAVVFGILEAMTAGLISVWFVAGAVAAMVAAILEAGVMVQAGVFIVVSALALALTRPLVRRWTKTRTVATNADPGAGADGQGDRSGGQRQFHGCCLRRWEDLERPQQRRKCDSRGDTGTSGADGGRQALCSRV